VLETFVQLGLAQKISNPEAKARFDAETRRHHHAVCCVCDKVMDMGGEEFNSLDLPLARPGDFQILDYSINFTGICPDCQDVAAQGRTGKRAMKGDS
jgi:Fur family peroxide stress response transcriptional regulator